MKDNNSFPDKSAQCGGDAAMGERSTSGSQKSGPTVVDVLVLGAGIAGLGAAAAAKARGYSVQVLERSTSVGGGASNNSLRIIHGGFRYLQTLNLKRMHRSLRAQERIAREFSDLVTPLRCVMPLERGLSLRSWLPVATGVWFFGLVAAFLRWPGADYRPRITRWVQDDKALRAQLPVGTRVLEWWDFLLSDPHALHTRLAAGLDLFFGAEVEDSELERDCRHVRCRDGRSFSARVVIDCRGSSVSHPVARSWAKAFNLLLRRPLHVSDGIAFRAGENRQLFAVPRERIPKYTDTGVKSDALMAVGTWYVPCEDGERASPYVSTQLVQHAFDEVQRAWPAAGFTDGDLVGIEVGVLPCLSEPARTPVRLVGSEQILTGERYITVLSTKYTTFQTQAEEAVAAASRWCPP